MKKIVMALMLISVSPAMVSPVIIKNNPLEDNWIVAKADSTMKYNEEGLYVNGSYSSNR